MSTFDRARAVEHVFTRAAGVRCVRSWQRCGIDIRNGDSAGHDTNKVRSELRRPIIDKGQVSERRGACVLNFELVRHVEVVRDAARRIHDVLGNLPHFDVSEPEGRWIVGVVVTFGFRVGRV